MHLIRLGKTGFVILDRYSFCRASTLNLDRCLSVEIAVEL